MTSEEKSHEEMWKSIFSAWEKVHSNFEKETEDCAYWYLERANTGMLALAVHEATGYQVLEEYPWSKKNLKTGEGYKGRIDLWFGDKRTNHTIESKITGFSANSNDQELKNAVENKINEALGWRDEGENTTRWIAVFVCFYVSDDDWKKKKTHNDWKLHTRDMVKNVTEFIHSNIHFGPEKIAFKPCDPDEGDNNRRIGVALFVKHRK